MTDDLRNSIREQILEELGGIRRDVASREESSTGAIAPDVAIGRVSRMDAIGNRAISDVALNVARARLVELERAQRWRLGTQSRCVGTINTKRTRPCFF